MYPAQNPEGADVVLKKERHKVLAIVERDIGLALPHVERNTELLVELGIGEDRRKALLGEFLVLSDVARAEDIELRERL